MREGFVVVVEFARPPSCGAPECGIGEAWLLVGAGRAAGSTAGFTVPEVEPDMPLGFAPVVEFTRPPCWGAPDCGIGVDWLLVGAGRAAGSTEGFTTPGPGVAAGAPVLEVALRAGPLWALELGAAFWALAATVDRASAAAVIKVRGRM
jgi:hypothetical protein